MKARLGAEVARAVAGAAVTDGEKEIHRNRLARFVVGVFRTAAG